MRYLDSSVVLAEILAERKRPPEDLWAESLVSSRLLAVEVWTRLHAYRVADAQRERARSILEVLSILDLDPPVLARAIEPFPQPIRALDAIHLASADFLRRQGENITIATYDARMGMTAKAMGFELYPLD